jgi:hypothetical protein
MSLSPAALARIRDRHTRYKTILDARIKALVARCDAAESLLSWEAWLSELAEIEHEAAKLQERSRRHTERTGRLVKRIFGEPKAPAPDKQR